MEVGKQFNEQTNYGWGLTFNLTGKAPAISKRIFETLEDATSYANDYNDSAIEGLLLSVVNDETDTNNGVYFVKSIKKSEDDEAAILVKVGSGNIDEIEDAFNKQFEDLKNSLEAADQGLEQSIGDLQTANQALQKQLGEGFTETNTVAKAIEEGIKEAKKSASTQVTNLENDIKQKIGTLAEDKTVVDMIADVESANAANAQEIIETKNIIDVYTINEKKISENPVLDSHDILVSEEYSPLTQPAENVVPGDLMTIAISKLEIMLANTTLALTAAINDLEMKIGSPSSYDEEGNITNEATGLYAKYEQLAQKIETNQ
jgi:hypothetical protein